MNKKKFKAEMVKADDTSTYSFEVVYKQHSVQKRYIKSLEQQNTALQARIKELEQPKTCDECKYDNMEEGNGLYHVYCGNCLRIHVDEF